MYKLMILLKGNNRFVLKAIGNYCFLLEIAAITECEQWKLERLRG